MSLEKFVKDPYGILAASAVVGISIYFAVEFVDFIIQGPLKGKEEVRKMRIKETCEKNCMRLLYKRGNSEITVGSGMLIRTERDFSKKSKEPVVPETEKDKEDQEQARKDNALLLTNYHVLHQLNKDTRGDDIRKSAEENLLVEPMTDGLFEKDGQAFRKDVEQKELIYYDYKCDLALLRINFADISGIMSGRASLELAKTNPEQLDEVYVTGFPEGVPTVKDPAAVTAVCFCKIDHASGPFKAAEKHQEDEDCFRCLKINTQVECGASGGPVMNAEKKIVGVTASKVDQKGDGCLAISVEQIHRFLKDAEETYRKAQNFGKHGIKIHLNEIEVDGESTAPKFFTVTDYNDSVEIFRKTFSSDPDNIKRIFAIDIRPGKLIDGKDVKKFYPSTSGVDSVLQQISNGTGQFQIKDIWYENHEGDNRYFTVNKC